MEYDIKVFLWPPAGGGIQMIQVPGGPVPVPIPFCQYDGVRDEPKIHDRGSIIMFTNRAGEMVTSNLPFTIIHSPRSEGDA